MKQRRLAALLLCAALIMCRRTMPPPLIARSSLFWVPPSPALAIPMPINAMPNAIISALTTLKTFICRPHAALYDKRCHVSPIYTFELRAVLYTSPRQAL